MRASEILRDLADLLDQVAQAQLPVQQPAVQSTPIQVQQPAISNFQVTAKEPADVQDSGTFVPPLQAKIELLKKSVNVDNVYDPGGPDETLTGKGADNKDELARMRQMAGIHPAVADEAANDEPLDV